MRNFLSDDRSRPFVSTVPLLLALLAVAGLACTGSDTDHGSRPAAGTRGIGVVDRVPDLEGSWRLASTVTVDTCGTSGPTHVPDLVLQITQAGTVLDIRIFNSCGVLLSDGTGTVDGNGVVTLSSEQVLEVDGACSLSLEALRSATVSTTGDMMTGSATLNVSGTGSCGPGVPCRVETTFTAEICPPADCTFRSC